jgi:catechol 2,3-dioxygenase-like lactoylglutathione lyase family enzyme
VPIAVFSLVALDCPDPAALAEFYRQIVGGTIEPQTADGDWVLLRTESGSDLGFQLAPDHSPPEWPDGTPQQLHLDFDVTDLEAGEQAVMAIGARKADVQPRFDEWRVFLDPAGHPFCLVRSDG